MGYMCVSYLNKPNFKNSEIIPSDILWYIFSFYGEWLVMRLICYGMKSLYRDMTFKCYNVYDRVYVINIYLNIIAHIPQMPVYTIYIHYYIVIAL